MILYIWIALLLTVISTAIGLWRIRSSRVSSLSSLVLGAGTFFCLMYALGMRGELRGACPLMDIGEKFLFTAWSLSFFYLVTGGSYRNSLLGLFTAPLLTILLIITLLPQMFTDSPALVERVDFWTEIHAATSVLSYGALALSALAAVMFLVLDAYLRKQQSSKLVMKMPPVNTLLSSIRSLLVVGISILTVGIVAGIVSAIESGVIHLIVAGGVWLSYLSLLLFYLWKGLTPRVFASASIGLFVLSCGIFFVI